MTGPIPPGASEGEAELEADQQAVKPPIGETRAAGRWSAAGMPVERSANFGASTRRLLRRMGPDRFWAALVVVLALASVALSVSGPRILGRATNVIVAGVYGATGIDYSELHRLLLIAAAVYAASALLSFLQSYVLAGVVQRTMLQLRADVEEKLHRLPLSYIDRHARGDLLSRVTNDIDNVAQSLQQTLSQMLTSVLTIVGVMVMMFTISWELALIALVTVPLSLWTVRAIARRSKPRFIAQWRHTGALNAQVEEAFTGHTLIRVLGRQEDVRRQFDEENEQLFKASFGAQFISGTIQPAMMFFGNLNYVAIAVVGGMKVASGSMSIGDIQAFIQYTRQFTQPLTQLASMANVMQSGIASAERVFDLLDVEEESPDDPEPLVDPEPRGRVEFDHVRFSYDPDIPLIEDLTFTAEPGETVAIVGPTGAGKTTLVNLIMRFYELDGGQIRLDGNDTARMTRRELRSNIGMVLQDTWLFGGTIRDNIAYGNFDATEEQIIEAAKATYVDRFVHSLPDGYDTILDEDAANVSAGEKQLITIARAMVKDAPLLILDEATSSVDTRTEQKVQQAMDTLMKGRTSFVIAHRLSTIRDADLILVMEHGDIVEKGTHDELIAAEGAYWRLYRSQFEQATTADEPGDEVHA